MKTLTNSFIRTRDKGTIPDTWRKVYLEEISTDTQTEITNYIAHIGAIEERIEDERKLNEFLPPTVTFTVTNEAKQDHKFFESDEESGLFDKIFKATVVGYRVILKEGIEGESDEIITFDGELDNESIDFVDGKTRAVFTATGWLQEAGRYDAGVVSDHENPPFKKCTGLTVDGVQGPVGGKYIQTGGKTGTGFEEKCWMSYNGGPKVYAVGFGSGTGTEILYEPNRQGAMTVSYVYSAMPEEPQKDYFSVREYGGSLIACGWWEHRTIEFAVNRLLDEWWGAGVGTRDIDVEEISGGVAQKMFIYLNPIYNTGVKEDVKVTACRIVEYNAVAQTATMLLAVQWKLQENNRLYKVEIDIGARTSIATEIGGIPSPIPRVARFYYHDGNWWGIVGRYQVGTIEAQKWYAVSFWRINLTTNIVDATKTIPYNHSLPGWYHYNLYSFTAINEGQSLQDEFYCIRQEAEPGMHYYVKLYKYDIGADTWANQATMGDEYFAFNHGTWAKFGATDQRYYWGGKRNSGGIITGTGYICSYDLIGAANTWIEVFGSDNSTGTEACLWKQAAGASPDNYAFIQIHGTGARADWLWNEAYWPVANQDKLQYFGLNNEDEDYYTAWHKDGDEWRIQHFEADQVAAAGNVETADQLDPDYTGKITAPKIMVDNGTGDFYYTGAVTDEANRVIPFLYIKGTTISATIKEFDLHDWSIRQALKYTAEGYLCYLAVPEYQKIQFYARKKNKGAFTLKNYKEHARIRIWKHFADGIHIQNSKYELSEKRGTTGKRAKVFGFDNRLTGENSIGMVADWYYAFLVTDGRRKWIEVYSPYKIEAELMDKVTIDLYNADESAYLTKETIIYEKSHKPWPGKSGAMLYRFKLLEIEGEGPIHELILDKRSITL